jgi:hypothetical protein
MGGVWLRMPNREKMLILKLGYIDQILRYSTHSCSIIHILNL